MARRLERGGAAVAALVLATAPGLSGCGGAADRPAEASASAPKPVVVTTASAEVRPVERAIEVVGTLHGWEEVTIGSKQTGKVLKVLHDVGDRVVPGEPLVELDPIDARLAVDEARTRMLAELIKLGLTAEQAESYTSRYGVSEEILANEEITKKILEIPSILEAQATLDQAQTRLSRQRQLAARDAGTVQELQDAESAQRIAQASLDNAIVTARTVIANALSSYVALQQAQEALREMTIAAPKPSAVPPGVESADAVDYAISRRHVSEGQLIRPGDSVYDLVLEHPLRLRCSVPERYVAEVAEGQAVSLTVAAYPGRGFEGTVSRINPAIDPVSRTFEVEAEVPNAERVLRPGGFAKARIVIDREDSATLVPLESVVRFAGVVKLFLFEPAADGERARELQVVTGSEQDGLIEVVGGLPDGAVVITSGQTRLADGTPVVLRPDAPRPDAAEGAAATPAEGAAASGSPAPTEAEPAK